MEFINKRAGLFKKLVVKHFINTYNLKIVNNIERCLSVQPNSIYVKSNCILMNNRIINEMYKSNLDVGKWSVIFVNYKNINFQKRDSEYMAILDTNTKRKILKTLMNFKNRNYIDEKILLIGRKYLNANDKQHKVMNCFGLMCTLSLKDIKFRINKNREANSCEGIENRDVSLDKNTSNSKSKLRRTFLMNIKTCLNQIQNGEIYRLISNGIYLDIEFTNDIYDDFDTFPISNDTSIIFMIGIYMKNKLNDLEYTDFTVNRLCKTDEHFILEKFLNVIEDKYEATKTKVLIFHWSNADKYIIEKSLQKYPELYLRYKNMLEFIQYVDLLKIFKQTIVLPSYSLKYVSKYFLNISYDSDCKNGLDAMCSIIQNEINLQKIKRTKLGLSCFQTTMDIVKYNKTDTTLLYQLLKYFIY